MCRGSTIHADDTSHKKILIISQNYDYFGIYIGQNLQNKTVLEKNLVGNLVVSLIRGLLFIFLA